MKGEFHVSPAVPPIRNLESEEGNAAFDQLIVVAQQARPMLRA
jgi:hypothetical protein